MTRVYIADALLDERSALRLVLLDLNMEVVGEAADWATTLANAPATRLDMLLISWELLPIDLGVQALATLRVACPGALVVGLRRRWRVMTATPPPLAAALKSGLFDPTPVSPTSTLESPTGIRCTYCGSDQVAPKSKQPRCKTIIDEDGEKHTVEVVRYYCHNPECQYHTFTHFPPGIFSKLGFPSK